MIKLQTNQTSTKQRIRREIKNPYIFITHNNGIDNDIVGIVTVCWNVFSLFTGITANMRQIIFEYDDLKRGDESFFLCLYCFTPVRGQNMARHPDKIDALLH